MSMNGNRLVVFSGGLSSGRAGKNGGAGYPTCPDCSFPLKRLADTASVTAERGKIRTYDRFACQRCDATWARLGPVYTPAARDTFHHSV
jgi:hypothetical protein